MTRAGDDPVAAALEKAIDPTASPGTAAPVDLPEVAPPARDAPGWLPWLGVAGAFGVGTLMVIAVRTGGSAWPVDETVHRWVLERRGTADSALARAVTWGGATTVVLPALAVLGALLRRGRRGPRNRIGAGLLLSGTAALGVWLGLLVNHAVGRERPPAADWWGTAGGPAFPSGHTTAGTLAAGLCAWALTARVTSRAGRTAVWCVAVSYAVGVGWSRVWLGVHWPSDVLGGWLLGASWVALVVSAVGLVERRWPHWFTRARRRQGRPTGSRPLFERPVTEGVTTRRGGTTP